MSALTLKYLEKPYLVLSFVLLMAIVGIIGYVKMPLNMYPDSDHPQITIITVETGASASDVETKIGRTIEKEMATLGEVLKVTSVSKDEVSVVTVEFDYTKTLDSAATDVSNALSKITGKLPADIRQPQIFKISQATQPTLILALSPKENSILDMSQIRQLADNEIKEELLRVPGIAQVEVFGGFQPEYKIIVKPDLLAFHSLTISDVAAALSANNVNVPNGLIIKSSGQYLLKTQGEFKHPEEANHIIIARKQTGDVYLRDVAEITRGIVEPQSGYHGNSREAIGLSILRAPSGVAMDSITAVEKYLPILKDKYPGIQFAISDTQGTLIRTSVSNMEESLFEAILLTVGVVFLFLANMRITLLAAVSIPFTYLITFGIMWLIGYELNTVTFTGIILAVGMLLDDAIVVLENIARHYERMPDRIKEATFGGTEEVLLAIFSGTYATVMVLLPIIFIGGYVQATMRPFIMSMCIALVVSYVVSVTIIPILAPMLLRQAFRPNRAERIALWFDEKVVTVIQNTYVRLVDVALRHRLAFLAGGMALFMISASLMPILGRDLMSSMDAGIIKINFETDTDMSLAATEQVATKIEQVIAEVPGVDSVSTIMGSEAGIVSFGSGKIPQQGYITINLVDRFKRSQTIWEIENKLRTQFAQIPGLKYVDVYDFGATAMASIKAPVSLLITGPDRMVLDSIGEQVYDRMLNVPGLTSVSRSWTHDKAEINFVLNKEKCSLYEISPANVSNQIANVVGGMSASTFRIDQEDGIGLRISYPAEQRDHISKLKNVMIVTPKGLTPLESLGTFSRKKIPTLYTRQDMQNTLEVYGYREKTAITYLDKGIQKELADIELPEGYAITQEGDLQQMQASFGAMSGAMGIGMLLLYFSLVPAFSSFIHPMTIMSAIPLGMIGSIWALMLSGKHSSMPAFMGMILLAGIVVKNSILLIDFIIVERSQGSDMKQAIMDSVRVRTRPILMTAFGTAFGMAPIALEWAVGLERLSPLAIVAIGGLLVSTFLTLVFVPILYTLFEDMKGKFGGFFRSNHAGIAKSESSSR
ncbi:Multidrug resistance protein MdtB [Sporomusa silvacetica DSM 10669]|uniref:Multidrug resistance protein MdtB n=1 Tax=Sporomusa silvacetica DSM 10669 TaxID=1123289 RepID=A0ABZ3IPL1_9FIRM|nr:efflux RND transporter permease subunit [Sporomusa silvacetica]OZC23444.1 multidrug resistance protein MdtB [Sporomusa silvacetica DSM 10669]